jgi:signal peptidase II
MRRWIARACVLLLAGSTIGCDQVSKSMATTHLMHAPMRSFLGGMVRLEYARNSGAFLSWGTGFPAWARTGLFTVGTGIILTVCVILAFRKNWARLPLAGLALLIGGGVSNLADRIRDGAVVDFLNVGVGRLRTGIFNVADMAIMLGLTLLVIGRRRRPTPPATRSG